MPMKSSFSTPASPAGHGVKPQRNAVQVYNVVALLYICVSCTYSCTILRFRPCVVGPINATLSLTQQNEYTDPKHTSAALY
jgi:hypothetical protein